MKNGFELLAEFNKGKDKAKDLGAVQKHIASTLPGFAVAMNWSGEPDGPLGYCTVFVHPPGQYSNLRPVCVMGKDEADTIKRVLGSVPRLLREIGESQHELEDGAEEDFEYQMRDRRRNSGTAANAAKTDDKPAPARQRGPRKAIRDGRVVSVHR